MDFHDTLIGRHIRRGTRNLVAVTSILTVIVLFGIWSGIFAFWQYNQWNDIGTWGLLAIGLLLVFVIVRNVLSLLAVSSDINRHWVVRQLARFGDPPHLAAEIDQETKRPRVIGPLSLTSSWLLRPYMFGIKAIPFDAVVWVYKRVIRHHTNFVPTGRSYAVIVCTRNGESLDLTRGVYDVDAILREVASRAPWAIIGYSEDLESRWNKSRRTILDQVDDRRRTLGKSAPHHVPEQPPL